MIKNDLHTISFVAFEEIRNLINLPIIVSSQDEEEVINYSSCDSYDYSVESDHESDQFDASSQSSDASLTFAERDSLQALYYLNDVRELEDVEAQEMERLLSLRQTNRIKITLAKIREVDVTPPYLWGDNERRMFWGMKWLQPQRKHLANRLNFHLGRTDERVNRFFNVQNEENEKESCIICATDVDESECVVLPACCGKHTFHQKCAIESWYAYGYKCLLCHCIFDDDVRVVWSEFSKTYCRLLAEGNEFCFWCRHKEYHGGLDVEFCHFCNKK